MDAFAILALAAIGLLPFSAFNAYLYRVEEKKRAKGEIKKVLGWLKHANVFLGLVAIYPALLTFHFAGLVVREASPGYFLISAGFLQILAFLLSMAIILEIAAVFGYVYFNSRLEEESGR